MGGHNSCGLTWMEPGKAWSEFNRAMMAGSCAIPLHGTKDSSDLASVLEPAAHVAVLVALVKLDPENAVPGILKDKNSHFMLMPKDTNCTPKRWFEQSL